MTKEQKQIYDRNWRKRNAEKVRESKRRWLANNREASAARRREYRKKNRERLDGRRTTRIVLRPRVLSSGFGRPKATFVGISGGITTSR
jgi:hypothetical protein